MRRILRSITARTATNTVKLKSKHAATFTEALTVLALAAVLTTVCLFGITSAARAVYSLTLKNTADILAQTAGEYIKNEIRFAQDPYAAIDALAGYEASLNGLSIENLTFSVNSNEEIVFGFTVADSKYEYKVFPLNQKSIPYP